MNCVYCGKEYDAGGEKIRVSNGTFDVCCRQCHTEVTEYLNRDKKYKNRMYVMFFCGSIGFILSTFIFSGKYKLVPMYIGMVIAGLALAIYPYIFTSFLTFTRVPIRKADRSVRIFGWSVIIISLVFLVLTCIQG